MCYRHGSVDDANRAIGRQLEDRRSTEEVLVKAHEIVGEWFAVLEVAVACHDDEPVHRWRQQRQKVCGFAQRRNLRRRHIAARRPFESLCLTYKAPVFGGQVKHVPLRRRPNIDRNPEDKLESGAFVQCNCSSLLELGSDRPIRHHAAASLLVPRRLMQQKRSRPSPQCLHDGGRFWGTREDASGEVRPCKPLFIKPLWPKVARHQPVRKTRPKGSNPSLAAIQRTQQVALQGRGLRRDRLSRSSLSTSG
jgi:hypothetical protein